MKEKRPPKMGEEREALRRNVVEESDAVSAGGGWLELARHSVQWSTRAEAIEGILEALRERFPTLGVFCATFSAAGGVSIEGAHPPCPEALPPLPLDRRDFERVTTGEVIAIADLSGEPEIAALARILSPRGVTALCVVALHPYASPLTLLGLHAPTPLAWSQEACYAVETGAACLVLALSALEAREAQRKIAERCRVRTEEMEHFLHAVAHDLKSPLITLRGFVDLLLEDLEEGEPEEIRRDIEQIRTAARRVEGRLDDLRRHAQVGVPLQQLERIPLRELVDEALYLLASQIRERGVQVQIDDPLPEIEGDRGRLLQVFQNLIENAVKFMGETKTPRIEIGGRTEGDCVRIFVRDNGIGIEPEDQKRIFRLFERLHAEAEGSGVGLSLVQRIVEVHGGKIWVVSEGGGSGSTFWIELPRKPSLASP